jgi:cell wall-associated NlpC family hydrolase
MDKIKRNTLSIFLILIVLFSVSSAAAAPVGTDESKVVKYAKSWVGVPNVHGGNDRKGIDCSHLVSQVYSKAGAKGIYFMKVPEIKKNKYYKVVKSPRPGDLVLWKKDVHANNRNYGLVSHVGILIGKGKFVHTSFDKKKVVIDSISKSPYKEGQPYYVKWTKK